MTKNKNLNHNLNSRITNITWSLIQRNLNHPNLSIIIFDNDWSKYRSKKSPARRKITIQTSTFPNISKNPLSTPPKITHQSPLPLLKSSKSTPILDSRGSREKGVEGGAASRLNDWKRKTWRLNLSQKRNEGGELAAKRLLAGRIKISVRTLLLLLLLLPIVPPSPSPSCSSCCKIKTGGRWPVTITRRYIYIHIHVHAHPKSSIVHARPPPLDLSRDFFINPFCRPLATRFLRRLYGFPIPPGSLHSRTPR